MVEPSQVIVACVALVTAINTGPLTARWDWMNRISKSSSALVEPNKYNTDPALVPVVEDIKRQLTRDTNSLGVIKDVKALRWQRGIYTSVAGSLSLFGITYGIIRAQ